ncbi:hypothetical protein OnM2_025110 [Erysiphe neolycopersici]|uniref:Uncharacterized protein n=1 Tax=Erysiphe neolycopersici TaxID=212602 RepID=A0A420I109_9PEZI|nr:hypothetical protein OnM2_025110 [Erysiphe neolycopersici]
MARAKLNDDAALGHICPRLDTDPSLICQVGRWSLSSEYSHEMPWPELLKIESFAAYRFSLTRFESLKRKGCSWFLGPASRLSGFTMPVCKHNNLAMKDKTVHGPGHKGKGKNSWAVLKVCGINGTETEIFFNEIGFLEGSEAWNSRSKYEHWAGGGTNELYNDRLVRYDAMNLLNYLRVHKGRDKDCDLVLNATKNMSPNEGHCWFCQKHLEYGMEYGHTIFSREAAKVEIPRIPPISVVPRPKTGLRWLKAQERKRLRHKEKAKKAARKKLGKEAEHAFRKSLISMTKKEAKVAKKCHKQQQLKETKKQRKKNQLIGVGVLCLDEAD